MKNILFTFAAFVMLFTTTVFAQDAVTEAENPFPSLHRVEAKYVCMANNRAFPVVQIPVEVEGKTYYGCCQMCEARLKKDESLRKGIDPVSGAEVDKADAVIGTKSDGSVYYFENEENYEAFQE